MNLVQQNERIFIHVISFSWAEFNFKNVRFSIAKFSLNTSAYFTDYDRIANIEKKW